MCAARRPKGRGAFTLIELLVVIAILVVLATIGALALSSLSDDRRKTGAAEKLSQWLLISKQQAKRDGVPEGLLLIPDPNNPGLISQVQYIQQPDPYAAGTCLGASPAPAGQTGSYVFFQGVAFSSEVQAGDYLELYGGGGVHQIAAVPSSLPPGVTPIPAPPAPPPQPGTFLQTTSVVTIPTATSNYRILRQPRPVLGEDILTLPQNMAIDLGTPATPQGTPGYPGPSQNVPQRAGNLEILFSPMGNVMGQGTGSGNIFLYVRDSTATGVNPDLGSPTLVGIQIRTGFIATYPVLPTDTFGNWQATREGRSSGM